MNSFNSILSQIDQCTRRRRRTHFPGMCRDELGKEEKNGGRGNRKKKKERKEEDRAEMNPLDCVIEAEVEFSFSRKRKHTTRIKKKKKKKYRKFELGDLDLCIHSRERCHNS